MNRELKKALELTDEQIDLKKIKDIIDNLKCFTYGLAIYVVFTYIMLGCHIFFTH